MYEPSGKPIVDLETGWTKKIKACAIEPLKDILDEGFKRKNLFLHKDYMDVYTTCYDMCTQRAPYNWSEQLYARHGETFQQYLDERVLPDLRTKHDTYLLNELVRRWNNHKIMNKWMKMFFTYLDRFYVKYHGLPSLEDSGTKHFKNIIYEALKTSVAQALLTVINDERENIVIDRSLIKSIVELFESMGMGTIDVYQSDLEVPLLESTRDFYSRKAALWSQEDSTPSYLLKAEGAFEEERNRAIMYLNPSSEPKIMTAMESELLAKKETELLEKEGSGLKFLLMNDKLDDLKRLYTLFSRLKDQGLIPIADIFRQHIIECGGSKVDERQTRFEQMPEKEREKNAGNDPQFIKDMLALHDKYIEMVTTQFSNHPLFQKALKDAFVDFVNRDSEFHNNAHLMASFCDQILKTGGDKLQDSEIEIYLEKIVQLFFYLTDKDIFIEIYRNLLAKRLLNQRSASDDMERNMISKLKLRCGGQFTSKVEGMLNDLNIGIDHKTEFDNYYKENDKLGVKMEFEVQVLTTGNWPTYKAMEIHLPPVLSRCVQVFNDFYSNVTTKRRLQWVHSLGNAVVKGVFAGKKSYDFQVTTLQAIVLLSFSNPSVGNIPFEALSENLNMGDENLKRVLHSLSCGTYKILKIMKGDGSPKDKADKSVKSTDCFAYNPQFSAPLRKIRVPMAALEESNNPKRVEEDRSIAIEASIVRIMKARKTLGHQQLIGEVLTQLSFFRPQPKVIKRRIEALIDRDYLERDADNSNVYKYLA